MNEIICLILEKLQTAHRNTWLYFRTIDNNFEETLIKTSVEIWSSGICTGRDQCGKGFNKFVQDLTNLVNYSTNNIPFLSTLHAILFKNFKQKNLLKGVYVKLTVCSEKLWSRNLWRSPLIRKSLFIVFKFSKKNTIF